MSSGTGKVLTLGVNGRPIVGVIELGDHQAVRARDHPYPIYLLSAEDADALARMLARLLSVWDLREGKVK